MRFFFFLFVISSLVFAKIDLQGKSLTASPDNARVQGQNIEILESTDCAAKVSGNRGIQLPDQCGYLHGLYRYIYLPENSTVKHQVLTDFAVERTKDGRYALMENAP